MPLSPPETYELPDALGVFEDQGLLRHIGARTKEPLVEVMAKALDVVTAQDAQGFFAYFGYWGVKQQLSKAL